MYNSARVVGHKTEPMPFEDFIPKWLVTDEEDDGDKGKIALEAKILTSLFGGHDPRVG